MLTPTPAAIWGSRPIEANSVVPIAKPPTARASSARAVRRPADGAGGASRAGAGEVNGARAIRQQLPGRTVGGVCVDHLGQPVVRRAYSRSPHAGPGWSSAADPACQAGRGV